VFLSSVKNVDLFAAPPPGGWVTTSFNDRDQSTESQVYGANGELISRLTRSYDAKGRVIESAHVIESFESLLPPATREQLESDPNAFEKMQAELAEFLGDQKVLARASYVYDDQGRVAEKHDEFGPSDNMITKITYNDHGDEAEEIRTTSHPPHSSEETDARFSYQYDSLGNWTERILSSPSTATEPSRIWTIHHRTITYY
jgi:hypothetical protein